MLTPEAKKAIGTILMLPTKQKEIANHLVEDFYIDDRDKKLLLEIKNRINKDRKIDLTIFDNIDGADEDYINFFLIQSAKIEDLETLYESIEKEFLENALKKLKEDSVDFESFGKKYKEKQELAKILKPYKPKTIQEIYMDGLNELAESGFDPDNLPLTGVKTFDNGVDETNRFFGFRKGQLTTIGALSGAGKSTLVFTMLKNLSKKHPSVFYSLEMSGFDSASRVFSQIARIPTYYAQNLVTEKIQRKIENKDFSKDFRELEEYKIFIDSENRDLKSIISNIRLLKRDENIEFVFLDFLQIVEVEKQQNRSLEVSLLVRKFKNLAMELGITIILLSQLNNASRNNNEPTIFDMKESGDIAAGSDLVILMWRDKENNTWLKLAKDRNNGSNYKTKINYDFTTRSYS